MITLTQEQEQAKQQLLDFLSKNDTGSIILQGIAGTGKTTLIKSVYEEWNNQQKLLKIIDENTLIRPWEFTATTNKACQALQESIGKPCITIHRLLKLTVGYDGLRPITVNHVLQPSIIVIDECSYIDYKLLDYIKTQAKDCQIIYMGDKTQLPPVGWNHSPVFVQKYPTVHLTKQLRQIHSPNIASFCRALQSYIELPMDFPKLVPNQEIIHLSKTDFDEKILNISDKDKLLLNKNTSVNKYNKQIFKNKHGRDEYKTGDVLINNHYVHGINTDEMVSIDDIQENEYLGVKGYDVSIRHHDYFLPKKQSAIKSVYRQLNQIDALKAKTLKGIWIDLRPPYACTVHKSQGSTYDNVYIDLNDFKTIRDLSQLAKLLYVAMSRARHKIYLTGDIR